MHTAASLLALGELAATAAAETVHGVVVFARHGDRSTKHSGNQGLTSLGAKQLFQVGSDYRNRYLSHHSPHQIRGISEDEYVPAQIYAGAPDRGILLASATSFLQGLYPPLGDAHTHLDPHADPSHSNDDDHHHHRARHLANGTAVAAPLEGYQYVTVHGISADSPDTVYLKGDDNCPAQTAASSSFEDSAEYNSLLTSTRDFYTSLHPVVSAYYPSPSDLSYAHAYDIYDLINVQHTHNASSPAHHISASDLARLRTLADSAEFNRNFNASQPERAIHAQSFAGAVVRRLNETVSSASNQPKFTLLAGSYDTFLSFFGLAGLVEVSGDFYGLPEYASTMAFELVTLGDDEELNLDNLQVRYLFRNGTEGGLTAFPLFGTGKTELPWGEFVQAFGDRGMIEDAAGWCGACRSEALFCKAYGNVAAASGVDVAGGNGEGVVSRGSWIAVLVVMAVAIAGNLVWAGLWFFRARGVKAQGVAPVTMVGKTVESVRSYDGKESV